jgi:hypothetical protein
MIDNRQMAEFLSNFAGQEAVLSACFFIFIQLVGALFNWVFWYRTPEEWEHLKATKPRLAWFIRTMRAIAPHLRKIKALSSAIPEKPNDGVSSMNDNQE